MKRNNYISFAAVWLCIFIAYGVFAQQNFTMYNMSYVPQRMYANPALLPKSRINIGLPVLSSIYLEAGNSGFKYKDIIHHRAGDDSLEFDMANVLSKLKKNNYATFGVNTDILSFGFLVKEKNYFSFNATEKIFAKIRYPKDFFGFAWNGNYPSAGETLKFNFGLDAVHYREFGLSYTRILNDKFNLGGRLKYLYGMENIRTKKTDITMFTDPNDFAITASSDIIINTAGLDSASMADASKKYLFGSGNSGFGIDLGGSYQVTEDIKVSASLVDIGYIKWKNGTLNFVSKNPGASFTYKGQNLNDYFSDSSDVSKGTEQMLDSLQKSFEIGEQSYAYTTALPMHIYLSSDYRITEKNLTSIMLYGHFFDGRLHPGISLSDIYDFGKWFSFIMSYSIYNRSFTNLGAGLRLNLGFFQWYLACDNVLGMVFPQQAKYVNARTGINLTFGRKNKNAEGSPAKETISDKDGDKVNDIGDKCPDQPGRMENHGCPEKLHMLNSKMDTLFSADINSEERFVFNSLPSDEVKFWLESDRKPEVLGIMAGSEEKTIKIGKDNFYIFPPSAPQLLFIDTKGNPVMLAKNKKGVFVFETLVPEPAAKFQLMNVPDSTKEVLAIFKDKTRKLKRDEKGLFSFVSERPAVYIISEDGTQLAIAYQNEDGYFVFKSLPPDQIKYSLVLIQPEDEPMPEELKIMVEGESIRKAVKGTDNVFSFASLTQEDAQQLSLKDAKDVKANVKDNDKTVVSSVFQNLEFDANSENIRPSSFSDLDKLAVLMKENSSWKLKLGGHTDNVKDDAYNLELSKKRVESVKNYLISAGIPADRIITRHFGEKYPIADNKTTEGKQKNRRVEMLFIVSGGKK